MNIREIIDKKIRGESLSKEEIEFFISGYTKNEITDYQAAALVTAIKINGMDEKETYNLTYAMTYSGETVRFKESVLDKHSTGGVGDKVTLVLMPILASLGYKVAKMSGRGLGYTGGTVDKLDSIPGFNMQITLDKFKKNVEKIGISLISQSEKIAPADKKIYALRDAIACTESIPLITSSIISKKVAAGARDIVIDVTYGSGAFMKTKEEAESLKKALLLTGTHMGINISACLTPMETPLGYAVGNSLEVMEAVDFLKGKEIPDLYIVVRNLMKELLNIPRHKVEEKLDEAISSGKAYVKFMELIENQGGDFDKFIEKYEDENSDIEGIALISDVKGTIQNIDALEIAKVAFEIGAGRLSKEDEIDYFSGVLLNKKNGDKVEKDELIAKIYIGKYTKAKKTKAQIEKMIFDAMKRLSKAYIIKSGK